MKNLSRWATLFSRLVLAAATLVFTMIGVRYVLNPAGAAAATGAVLNTPLALTTTRVGFGALPLAIAVFALLSLWSSSMLRAGVRLVAIVISSAILVRAIGMIADGAVPASSRLFVPETVILVFALTGLFLQRKARQGAES